MLDYVLGISRLVYIFYSRTRLDGWMDGSNDVFIIDIHTHAPLVLALLSKLSSSDVYSKSPWQSRVE